MESEEKIKKRTISTILLCILMFILILFLTSFIYMKRNGIHLIRGKITVSMEDIEYYDGTFLIRTESSLYIDASKTLSSVNSQFHLKLKEGDLVYVFCKIEPWEIYPGIIDILYMIKL